MKKFLVPAIVFVTAALFLGGCHQPVIQADNGLSAPKSQQRRAPRPATRNYPDDNRTVYDGSLGAADSPDGEQYSSSESQDYIDMPEDKPLRTMAVRQEEVLPSMTFVNARLAEYGKKLDRWRELDRQSSATAVSPEESAELITCFQKLQQVMSDYSTLRANMFDSMNAATKTVSIETARDLYKRDIDFLESRCGLMLMADPPAPQIADGPLQATEDTLLRNYVAGNYETVLQLWQALPADQGVRLRVSAQHAAAQSMLRQGDEKGAVAIYKNLLQRLDDEDSPDILELRRNLADISFATGDTTLALRQYRLIDSDYRESDAIQNWALKQATLISSSQREQQREYADLMRRWLLYQPERDGFTVRTLADNFLRQYPNSAVKDNVLYIREDTRGKAENWINGLPSTTDRLAARKKFQETGAMVDPVPTDNAQSERETTPQRKSGETDFAGAAITTPQQREEASQAAQDERRKAAKLYERYTMTQDIEQKKKLLLESRRILKDILLKYPDVPIAPRVMSNIERVEQEIRSVDPNLLPYTDGPKQESSAYGQPQ